MYRHHTDDFHPCYLPDGRIVFASTRCERGVLCDQSDTLSVNTLYRINGDGSGLEMLSEGALSESTPCVMNDGRILYNAHIFVKILHGSVPVREDGSAHFVVPADKNLFFQAIDEDFMEVQRMRTFVRVTCQPPDRRPAGWPLRGQTVPGGDGAAGDLGRRQWSLLRLLFRPPQPDL
ncbi:MAG: HzsA-related protein [Pirellulaceae bacterium]